MRQHWYVMALAVTILGSWAGAQENHWGQWRGPNFNGSSAARGLPARLDPAAPLWVTPMPGHSNGTAIVWGDRIFTTAVESGSNQLLAICLAKKDGKILWKHEVGEGFSKNRLNDYATPSPVTDGKSVFFLYGNGHLLACDVEGKQLWKRNLQKDHGAWNMLWIYGASPLLYKGTLYVPVLHRNVEVSNWKDPAADAKLADSYLLAIDPATGKDLWKQVRPSDAKAESREAYTTPIPWERPNRTELLIVGGDCITSHDPQTGRELWRAGGWNPQKITHWRLVPSAVTFEGLAFVCTPKKEGFIFAVKEGGAGDITPTHIAWKSTEVQSDVCVPLVYKGNLYVLDGDKKTLSCLDPRTGTKKWFGRFDSRTVLRGSPTGADDKIYCTNEAGDVYICSADEFNVLAQASLGSGTGGGTQATRCSVAAVDGMIIVRTGDKVWAFAGK